MTHRMGLVVLIGLSLTWHVRESAAEGPLPSDQRREQEKTMVMARQLIGDILDIQLSQFSENGMEGLPVYGDIRAMRANLDTVCANEMAKVVELLQRAQRLDGEARDQRRLQARQTARQIVVVLMAERERIRRRLQTARLNAQLQQLIDKQQSVAEQTRELAGKRSEERDSAILQALENQRDTANLFEQMKKSLEQAKEWDSKEGEAARQGVEELERDDLDDRFPTAEKHLEHGEPEPAEQVQEEIIESLQRALEKMDEASRDRQPTPDDWSEKVGKLLDEQRQLMQDTAQSDDPSQVVLDQLSQRQQDVNQQLDQLEPPPGLPATDVALANPNEGQPLSDEPGTGDEEPVSGAASSDRESASEKEAAPEKDANPENGAGPTDAGQTKRPEGSDNHRSEEAMPREAEPGAEQLLDAARQAGRNAEEQLFEGDPSEAPQKQKTGVDRLEQLQKMADQAARQPADSNGPQSLVDQVQQLEQLDSALANLDREQTELSQQLANEPLRANGDQQQQQQEIAEQLAGESQRTPLPEEVQQSVEQAAGEAGQAAQEMQSQESTAASQSQAAARAQAALSKARQMTAQQLAAARSQQGVASLQQLAASMSDQPSDAAATQASQSSQGNRSTKSAQAADLPAQKGGQVSSDQGRVDRDVNVALHKSVTEAPWFAQLPPELREAIRARVRRQVPRGYEKKLREYFQHKDQ